MNRRNSMIGSVAFAACTPISTAAFAAIATDASRKLRRRTATCYQLVKDKYGTTWNLCRDYGAFHSENDGALVLEALHPVFGGHREYDLKYRPACEYGFNEKLKSPFDDEDMNRYYNALPFKQRVMEAQEWVHNIIEHMLMKKGYIPYSSASFDAPARPVVSFEENVAIEMMFDLISGKLREVYREDKAVAYIKRRWPVSDREVPGLARVVNSHVIKLLASAAHHGTNRNLYLISFILFVRHSSRVGMSKYVIINYNHEKRTIY